MCTSEPLNTAPAQRQRVVLELTVNNHPGVLSHVSGLFARRAWNLEGVLCIPVGAGERSVIWLIVGEGERLEQMIKQVIKLEDVIGVRRRSAGHEVFTKLKAFFLG